MDVRRKGLVPTPAADQPVTQQHVLAVAQPAHVALLNRRDGNPLVRAVQVVPVPRRFERIALVVPPGEEHGMPRVRHALCADDAGHLLKSRVGLNRDADLFELWFPAAEPQGAVNPAIVEAGFAQGFIV